MPDSYVKQILASYEVNTEQEVRAWVRNHPAVAAVLAEAPTQVAREFGENTPLLLQLVTEEDSEQLFVTIVVNLHASTAREWLKNLHSAWWNERRKTADADIYFDITYQ